MRAEDIAFLKIRKKCLDFKLAKSNLRGLRVQRH